MKTNAEIVKSVFDEIDRVATADLLTLMKLLREKGGYMAREGINPFLYRFTSIRPEYYGFHCPDFVTDFIAHVMQPQNPKTIFDPKAGLGMMISGAAHKLGIAEIKALETKPENVECAEYIRFELPVEWHRTDPLEYFRSHNETFDVVVSFPPEPAVTGEGKKIGAGERERAVVFGSMMLNGEGKGFFIVNHEAVTGEEIRKTDESLAEFGMNVEALFSLPPSSIPGSPGRHYLLVTGPRKADKIFMGELTFDDETNKITAKNLRNRKKGKLPQLGVLVKKEGFVSFGDHFVLLEMYDSAKRSGLTRYKMGEVSLSIEFVAMKKDLNFPERENSIYIPMFSYSPVLTSLDDLNRETDNYLQVALKPDKAYAPYLALIFNTPFGEKIREAIRRTKINAVNVDVYMPSVEIQKEVFRINGMISESIRNLEKLQSRLLTYPRKAADVYKSFKKLNKKETFEGWIESLPFPISSILWSYHAEKEIPGRISELLRFFEAFAEFVSTVILSILSADPALYAKECSNWLTKDEKYRYWYLKSDFGGWTILAERLAKGLLKLLRDPATKERTLDLSGRPSDEFIKALTDKNLFAILKETAKIRNAWKGHGGKMGPEEAAENCRILEDYLESIRKIVSDSFGFCHFIIPLDSTYSEGVFEYRAKSIMGTRVPFRKIKLETLTPMDSKKIYLIHNNKNRPVEMLPLFKMLKGTGQEENACYFYNRIEGERVRWVSYHFDERSEFYSAADEMEKTLGLLEHPDFGKGQPE